MRPVRVFITLGLAVAFAVGGLSTHFLDTGARKDTRDRLVVLAEQQKQALAVLNCASGTTVLIPASDPAWRLRAYKRCLVLNGETEYDELVKTAVDQTKTP